MDEKLKRAIARMCTIKGEQQALKAEYEQLEGVVLKAAEGTLEDTKGKTVSYTTEAGTATATMAESLKIIYGSHLHQIFGKSYNDVVTIKMEPKLSAPASRMLIKLWQREYVKTSINEIIMQIPVDEKTRAVLSKKLKGVNPETDKKALMSKGGMDEETANYYAYFLAEARVWTDFNNLLQLNGSDANEILTIINSAVVVEATPKITIVPRCGD